MSRTIAAIVLLFSLIGSCGQGFAQGALSCSALYCGESVTRHSQSTATRRSPSPAPARPRTYGGGGTDYGAAAAGIAAGVAAGAAAVDALGDLISVAPRAAPPQVATVRWTETDLRSMTPQRRAAAQKYQQCVNLANAGRSDAACFKKAAAALYEAGAIQEADLAGQTADALASWAAKAKKGGAQSSAPKSGRASSDEGGGDLGKCAQLKVLRKSGSQYPYKIINDCHESIHYVVMTCDADRSQRNPSPVCKEAPGFMSKQTSDHISGYSDLQEPRLLRVCNAIGQCFKPIFDGSS